MELLEKRHLPDSGLASPDLVTDDFNDGVLGPNWEVVAQTGGTSWDESGGTLNVGGSSGQTGELVIRYNRPLEDVGSVHIDYRWISYSGHKARVGLGLFDWAWGYGPPLDLDVPGAVFIKGVRYQSSGKHAVDGRVDGTYRIAYSVPTSGSLMIERNVNTFRLRYFDGGWNDLYEGQYDFGGTALYPYLFTSNSHNNPSWEVALDNFQADVLPAPSAWIVDDGDMAFSETPAGSFTVSANGAGAFGDHRISHPDSGNTATWTFDDAGMESGSYIVSATWVHKGATRASNATYNLTTASTSTPVTVNQKGSPNDFIESGIPWENLGVVQITQDGSGPELTVTLSDLGANGEVDADAIRLAPAPEIEVWDGLAELVDGASTVDFGSTDLGEHVTTTITVRNTSGAHLELVAVSVTGSQFSLASQPVSTSLPPFTGSTTFAVRFDATSQGTFTGAVSIANNDFDENPFNFRLTGSALRPQGILKDDGASGFSAPGFVRFTGQGLFGDVHYSGPNWGNTAEWSFTGLTPGDYQVAATWTTHRNRATNAQYRINGTNVPTVNQERNPNDYVANDRLWEVLGEASVGPAGTLSVTLTDIGANDYVIADAIRLEPVSTRVLDRPGEFMVIDNGDPGYSTTSGAVLWKGAGYQDDLHYMAGDGSGDQSTWTFAADPGIYQVAVTWTSHENRAPDVDYTITAGTNTVTVQDIYQRMPPAADITADGVAYQILDDDFEVPVGTSTLEISVSDSAGGYVIMDAVMVRMVSPLDLSVTTIVGNDRDGQIGADGSIAGIFAHQDRTGTGGNNHRGLALIYFFELPTFSPLTTITGAELEFEYVEKTDTPEFNIDLFGIDARLNPVIQVSDYYDGHAASSSDTLIQTAIITPSTSLGHLSVANLSSLNFVNSLYNADGTPISTFATFRANPDKDLPVGSSPIRGYFMALADHSNESFRPRLNLTTVTIPGPTPSVTPGLLAPEIMPERVPLHDAFFDESPSEDSDRLDQLAGVAWLYEYQKVTKSRDKSESEERADEAIDEVLEYYWESGFPRP
jgi:hypothetical protein